MSLELLVKSEAIQAANTVANTMTLEMRKRREDRDNLRDVIADALMPHLIKAIRFTAVNIAPMQNCEHKFGDLLGESQKGGLRQCLRCDGFMVTDELTPAGKLKDES